LEAFQELNLKESKSEVMTVQLIDLVNSADIVIEITPDALQSSYISGTQLRAC
jgi:ketol-acid reductoisomerase